MTISSELTKKEQERMLKRSKKGFTLAELLLAIAIIAMLSAIIVPGVVALKTELTARALDDIAREIYMSAQNTLTARRSAGTVGAWGTKKEDGEYWLSDADADLVQLLPPGAVGDAEGNHILISYNKTSGTVLEVFYSEDTALNTLSESTLQGYAKSTSKRKKAGVGFYAGTDVAGSNVLHLAGPVVTVKNGEALTVTVTVNRDDELVGKQATLKLVMEELGSDGTPGTAVTLATETLVMPTAPSVTVYTKNLDSLTGQSFHTQFPEITPGANVKLTATLSMAPQTIDGEQTTFLPGSSNATANSLFASRADGAVYISSGRHLQNLSTSFSGVETSVTAAEQEEPIVWSESYPSLNFAPIYNTNLTSFNGNGNEITDLRIQSSGDAGLFRSFTGTLSGVRLKDPTFASGTFNTYAGFLAGYVQSSTITDCRVYSDDENGLTAGAAYVGGLVGGAKDTTLSLCSASLKSITADGKTVGGLVGYTSGSSRVEGSYASFGYLHDGTGKWDGGITGKTVGGLLGKAEGTSVQHCYTDGYVAKATTAAGLLGTDSTGCEVQNYAYSAVRYGDDVGQSYGLAKGNTVANQCFYWYSGNAHITERQEAKEKSLKDLVAWSFYNASWTKRTTSTTYTSYCKSPYPYPVLQNLPHYGDWPIENVTGIRFYEKNLGTTEIPYLLCPVNSTLTFYPTSMIDDTKTAGEQVTFSEFSESNITFETELDINTDRTIANVKGLNPGVYTAMAEAGGARSRFVVIVYEAELNLRAATNGTMVTNTASTTNEITEEYPALQRVRNQMKLDTTGKLGAPNATFEATELVLHPTAAEITSAFASFRAVTSTPVSIGTTVGSTKAETDWNKLNTVVNNTDIGGGVRVLSVDSTDPLKISGKSAGPASVTSTWAINELLTVTCDIDVEGVQVLIQTATGKALKSGATWSETDYPYQLAAYPLAGEGITVTLQPYLFDAIPSGKSQQFVWEIYDSSDNIVATTTVTNSNAVTLNLTDTVNPFGRYKAVLKFSYGNSSGGKFTEEYKTADFMYITVNHRADDPGTTGLQPIVVNVGTDRMVEQIDWPTGSGHTDHCNQTQICGYVNGADDTQLLWYLMDENATDANPMAGSPTPLASTDDAVTVIRNNQELATLTWSNVETEFDGKQSIGGTVTVTAINRNDTTERTFKLVARARNNGDSDNAVTRVVTVHVMPKLQIEPESLVRIGYYGQVSPTYRSNREHRSFEPSSYAFSWKNISTTSGLTVPNTNTSSVTLSTTQDKNNDFRKFTIQLTYGPYTSTARLTARRILDTIQTCINGDSEDENNDYFLVEQGTKRDLMFSWGKTTVIILSTEANLTSHPQSNGIVSFTKDPGSSESGSSTGLAGISYGEFNYSVDGLAYGSSTMSWGLKWGGLRGGTKTVNVPVYVVGINGNKSTVSLTGLETSDTLTLSSYFPKAVGTGTVTMTSSNPEVMTCDTASYAPTGNGTETKTVTVTGHKYGTAILTATYTIGTREYKESVQVRILPQSGALTASLIPCTEEDRDELVTLFGGVTNDLNELVTYANYDTFRPTLFCDPIFKRDTIYLKSAVLADGTPTTDYSMVSDIRFSSSNANAARVEVSDHAVDGYWYLKITAFSGTVNGDWVDISADYGTILAPPMRIRVYSNPSVLIRRDSDSGTDITNKHTNVPYAETFSDYTYYATLSPELCNDQYAEIEGLNAIHWYAEYPSEDFAPFLTLTGIETSTVKVHINVHHRCKVAITAQSALAHNAGNDDITTSAHAMVFIPANS